MQEKMRSPRLKGIRRKGHRWEVYVRVNGELWTQTFPLDTHLSQMQAWREGKRAHIRPRLAHDALGRAAVRYLKTVQHQPDRVNKRHYMGRWLGIFGKYRRLPTITPADVEIALSHWLTTMSPTTVRHHRTALAHLYRVANGKHGYNPVLETPRPKDREPEARAARLDHVVKVLTWLPWDAWRARLLLILCTGIPHKQIGQLSPDDWDKKQRILKVGARQKGQGARGRLLVLSDAGQSAMVEFARVNAWGPFHPSNLHKRVTAACQALKIKRFRPYDLRHTQGALIYEATGDLKTVARLLGHVGTKTTERYTQSVWNALDRQATAKVGVQLGKVLEKAK